MNLSKAIQLVFSRRKRIEYTAWENWAQYELGALSYDDDLDLDNSVMLLGPTGQNITHADRAYFENLNAEWDNFKGGEK